MQFEPRHFLGVTISSTFSDLWEHRDALIKIIASHGFTPIAMENDAAKLVDVIDSSLQMVREGYAYIGVISMKYGQIPKCPNRNPDNLSITELEFNEALRLGRPILLFIIDEEHLVRASDVECNAGRKKKLKAFKERAKKMSSESSVHRVYSVFKSLEDFQIKAATSLAHLKERGRSQPAPPPSIIPGISVLLPPRQGNLIGRNAELNEVFRSFSKYPVVIIEGMPGVGKTSLALEAGYIVLKKSNIHVNTLADFDAALWITAKDNPEQKKWFNDVLNRIAVLLGYSGVAQNEFNAPKIEEVTRLLASSRVLIIIDNFETIEDDPLTEWLLTKIPQSNKVLITSRKQIEGKLAKINLSGLSHDEALKFIKQIALDGKMDFLSAEPAARLKSLIKATDGNPQALLLSIGLIAGGTISLKEIVTDLKDGKHPIGVVFEKLLNASWTKIKSNAQCLLLVTPFFTGTELIYDEALRITSNLSIKDYGKAKKSLIKWKLLKVEKNNSYSIHSITREFAEIELKKGVNLNENIEKLWSIHYLKIAKQIIRDDPNVEYWNVLVSSKMEIIDANWESINEVFKWACKQDEKKLVLDLVLLLVHYMDSRFLNLERMQYVQKAVEAANEFGLVYEEALLKIDSLGWTYVEENNLQEASRVIQDGIRLAQSMDVSNPRRKELIGLGYAWFARTIIELDEHYQAKSIIEDVIIVMNNKPYIEFEAPAWIKMRIFMAAGDIYTKRREFELALNAYEEAKLQLNEYGGEGDNYQINYRLGLAYFNLDKIEDAINYFEEAKKNKKIPICKLYGEYGMALVNYKKGDKIPAEKSLNSIKNEINKKASSNLLLKLIEDLENRLKDPFSDYQKKLLYEKWLEHEVEKFKQLKD